MTTLGSFWVNKSKKRSEAAASTTLCALYNQSEWQSLLERLIGDGEDELNI